MGSLDWTNQGQFNPQNMIIGISRKRYQPISQYVSYFKMDLELDSLLFLLLSNKGMAHDYCGALSLEDNVSLVLIQLLNSFGTI